MDALGIISVVGHIAVGAGTVAYGICDSMKLWKNGPESFKYGAKLLEILTKAAEGGK